MVVFTIDSDGRYYINNEEIERVTLDSSLVQLRSIIVAGKILKSKLERKR